MKAYLIGWLVMAITVVWGGEPMSAVVTNYSSTGQFVVYGVPIQQHNQPSSRLAPSAFLKVDPALLAVSCERIKQLLLNYLSAEDRWMGRIHIFVQFTVATNRPVSIESSLFAGRWRYRMLVPDEIEKNKLARALVNVILLEIVNREAGNKMVEVPLWLMEGFTRILLSSSGDNVLLQPQSLILRQEWKRDPVQIAQNEVKISNPLSFEQLSFPEPDTLSRTRWNDFQASSHLFVMQLLHLPQGQSAMQEMLRILPSYENWQLAFFHAFRRYFRSVLEAEKWWSLVIANLGGQDRLQGWSFAASWSKLDEILRLSVWIQANRNVVPQLSEIPVQQLIEHWDDSIQRPILSGKLNQLKGLRLHAPVHFIPLLDAYVQSFENYLYANQSGSGMPKELPQLPVRLLRKEFLRKLAELETRRQTLQPENALSAQASQAFTSRAAP